MVTILYSDIRGFTAFCESKDPAVIVDLLNVYMATMCGIIVKHHGHVNKFIGDGILAVFSDHDEGAEPGGHAARAIRCALEMVTAPGDFATGTGMHSGEVVIGNVGSSDKMEFTVLGDTVNLASRLESLNKEHKTKLLLSGATHDMAAGAEMPGGNRHCVPGGSPGKGKDRTNEAVYSRIADDGGDSPEPPFGGKRPGMMHSALRWFVLGLAVSVPALMAAADMREEPVGLILAAPGGKVLRANTETALAARAGDILFSGDSLRALGAPASFLYCPGKSSQTLDAGGEVLLDTKQLKVKSGKLDAPKPVNACFLPQMVRVAVASQQHYGVSMTRGLAKPEGDVLAFNALPAAVRRPRLRRSNRHCARIPTMRRRWWKKRRYSSGTNWKRMRWRLTARLPTSGRIRCGCGAGSSNWRNRWLRRRR